MSSARYIEIDSTYRDRNNWPIPSEFEVLIAQSGRKGQMDAVDPVSLSAPLYNRIWRSNSFIASGGSTITVTILSSGVGNAGDTSNILMVSAPAGHLQELENYYVGAVGFDTGASPNVPKFRVLEYLYLGNNRAQFRVQSFGTMAQGDTLDIIDPTDISDPENAYLFIPAGRNGINAYPDCIIYNETRKNFVNALFYDNETHLLKVGDITGLGWANTDYYCLRRQPPAESGVVDNNVPSINNVSLPVATAPSTQNVYRNGFIRINEGTGPVNEARRIVGYETYSGTAVGGSLNTIIFPNSSSNRAGYYNGMFIQITSGVNTGDTRLITNYDPMTRTATVSTNFSVGVISAGDQFAFRNLTTLPFSTEVQPNDTYEIQPFSHDNMNPFSYSGSMVSQQEMVCYEIELLNLILPNKTLNSGLGSRIAFYPFVYVEISNVSGAGAGPKNTIYSNNPNSTTMVFRATIDDVPNPVISSFVKIDGDGMVQTLKFKPNDNLRFSVRLPNGELYRTLDEEEYGPHPPNPELQISAVFSIKRL